jgi:hypothetical protein
LPRRVASSPHERNRRQRGVALVAAGVAFADLRREYEREQIGPLLWQLLFDVCRRVARTYPPGFYNEGLPWSEDSFRDLAQDVTVRRLLEEGQLDYAFDVADDEDSLARVLALQVTRVLSHRRRRSVVDRLATRIRKLAGAGVYGFRLVEVGSQDVLCRSAGGEIPELRFLPDPEIRRTAHAIEHVPRLRATLDRQRESMVYRREDLVRVVGVLLAEVGPVTLSDVRKILDTTLTAWLPTFLREIEVGPTSSPVSDLEFERSRMAELIGTLAREIDPVQRTVLLGKSREESDSALSARLGRSRPWVADRKGEVFEVVAQHLSELSDELHEEAFGMLLDVLARSEETAP